MLHFDSDAASSPSSCTFLCGGFTEICPRGRTVWRTHGRICSWTLPFCNHTRWFGSRTDSCRFEYGCRWGTHSVFPSTSILKCMKQQAGPPAVWMQKHTLTSSFPQAASCLSGFCFCQLSFIISASISCCFCSPPDWNWLQTTFNYFCYLMSDVRHIWIALS